MNTRGSGWSSGHSRISGALLGLVAVLVFATWSGVAPAQAAAANGTFSFSSATYDVVEGQQAVLILNRTGGFVGRVDVQYTVAAGSGGTVSADYGGITTGYVSFADGETQRQLLIQTGDNLISQSLRTFVVTMTGFSVAYAQGVIGSTNVATVTITDNDGPPTYSFSAASSSVSEGAGAVNVAVTRSGSTAGTDVVSCSRTSGTATLNTDFTFTTQSITFNPGETTKNCVVTINQDAFVDAGETIILDLTGTSGFGGGAGTYASTTLTITDDDAASVQWSATDFNVSEGNSGTSLALISATRTGDLTGAVTVPWSATNGTASTFDSDFVAGGGSFSWAAGVGGPQNATVQIVGDTTPETDETIQLSFGAPTGNAAVGTPASATITILNDDSASTLSFSATNYNVTEASTTVTVTVVRGGSSLGTVGATYTTSNGTATAGADYTATSGVLTFGTGVTSQTFSVTILNDLASEPLETINLALSSFTGGAAGTAPTTATITIFDDETGNSGVVVTSVTPASGPLAGGNTVILTGNSFTGGTLVFFGGLAGLNVNVTSPTTISVTAPAAAVPGLVDVTVLHPTLGLSSTAGTGNDYTYTNGPTVTLVSPNTGPTTGLTFVTVTGTNFTPTGMTVTFGGTAATFSYSSPTSLIAVSPAHSAGVADVIVTTSGGASPNTVLDDFTYTGSSAPVITGISPTSGPVGTVVIVTGSGFTAASGVTVGGVPASFTVNSDSQITVTVPSGVATGVLDIRVTTANGTSANVAADNFTNTTGSAATTTYVLYFRWTLIAWTGIDNISANSAIKGIETGTDNPATNDVSGQVTALWYWDGASQSYKGYFVGSENVPGANDFTTLRRGVSYWVAVRGPGNTNWTVLLGQ